MKLGEHLYRAQQEAEASAATGPAAGDGAAAPEKDGPEIVDADYTEVDDEDSADKKRTKH